MAYRSSGEQRKGYVGEAFTTTNNFLVDKLVDPMLSHIRGYERQDSEVLAPCYNKVRSSDKGSSDRFIRQALLLTLSYGVRLELCMARPGPPGASQELFILFRATY